VGVIGAGQLALMMGEEKFRVPVSLQVLAERPDDPATEVADATIIGGPRDPAALRELLANVDVITFDHELVDLELLASLAATDVDFRPGLDALRFAVDKAHQRRTFAAAGLPVPRFLVASSRRDHGVTDFLDTLAAPPVVKAARGGYDGRGVLFPATNAEALDLLDEMGAQGEVVLEERLTLQREIAQMIARGIDGDLAAYPVVTTVQSDGMCVETRFPTDVGVGVALEANRLTHAIAELVGGVGVMAVEYFVTPTGLVINEVALRPHNSGHWTIEGTTHSQFENHLRCVAGLTPLTPEPTALGVVMVNLVGAATPSDPGAAAAVPGAFVHDYRKVWRPGRKLGHVTALGDSAELAGLTAWKGAVAYGTTTKELP
jgi:5-(carboxyamino)imidazole ribonucleotide synthase